MSALDEKYTIDKLYNNKISHFEKHESVKITINIPLKSKRL